jgi:protein ImuB
MQGPWPGHLPSPSPAMVYADPPMLDVLDGDGHSVRVTGRGAVSAAPATVRRGATNEAVVAWAGPWPLEERWWDAVRSRRSARFQLQTVEGSLLLVCLEQQQWRLLGDYC